MAGVILENASAPNGFTLQLTGRQPQRIVRVDAYAPANTALQKLADTTGRMRVDLA
jgi:hypothetical protein